MGEKTKMSSHNLSITYDSVDNEINNLCINGIKADVLDFVRIYRTYDYKKFRYKTGMIDTIKMGIDKNNLFKKYNLNRNSYHCVMRFIKRHF